MKSRILFLLIAILTSLNLSVRAQDEWNPQYTIDFLAGFDPDGAQWAIEKCGSLEAYGEKVVGKMNQVMQNSKINGKFRLIGTYTISQNISDIPRWASVVLNDRALMKHVEDIEADMCIVFARCKGSTAPESGSSNFRAGHGMQYACVLVNSGIETNTAIHEAGHVMGCHHAYEMDGGAAASGDTCTYNYAAERTTPDGHTMSTVMGYHGELLPHFSSPNLIYNGVQMGSDHEDNCRVLNTRMHIISRLGDKRTQYWLSLTEKQLDYRAQSFDVEIEALKAWRITTDSPDWLKPSAEIGYTENISITASANNTGKVRVGHVTVSDFDATNPEYTGDILGPTVITITQYPNSGGKEVKITSISFTPKEYTVAIGKTLTLAPVISPSDATNQTLLWQSENPKIATVSDAGVVTPLKEGTAVIWATTTDGTNLGDVCEVTVIKGDTPPGPTPKPCAKPTIAYQDGQLKFSCETERAEYFYTITSPDMTSETKSSLGTKELAQCYDITVYAKAPGTLQSETVTARLYLNKGSLTGKIVMADVNQDGDINAADVVSVYNYIINGE